MNKTVTMIVAMNADRVIGVDGKIPWRHSADQKRFKKLTLGATVVMGRKTWESIPAKFRPLPARHNVVVTSTLDLNALYDGSFEGPTACSTVKQAIDLAEGAVWLIGGASIYAEGMKYADSIDVTWVPNVIDAAAPNPTYMPLVDEAVFAPGPLTAHPDSEYLTLQTYTRR